MIYINCILPKELQSLLFPERSAGPVTLVLCHHFGGFVKKMLSLKKFPFILNNFVQFVIIMDSPKT